MTLMPMSRRARTLVWLTSSPLTKIWPESWRCAAVRILMSVDFPAPFSPTRQCTSPGRRSKLTSSSATVPSNRFVRPTALRRSGAFGATAGGTVTGLSMFVEGPCRRARERPPAGNGFNDARGESARCELLPRLHHVVVQRLDLGLALVGEALEAGERLVRGSRNAFAGEDLLDVRHDDRSEVRGVGAVRGEIAIRDLLDTLELTVLHNDRTEQLIATCGLNGLERADPHLVVLPPHQVNLPLGVLGQEVLHGLHAGATLVVAVLDRDDLDTGVRADDRLESLVHGDLRRGADDPGELDDVSGVLARLGRQGVDRRGAERLANLLPVDRDQGLVHPVAGIDTDGPVSHDHRHVRRIGKACDGRSRLLLGRLDDKKCRLLLEQVLHLRDLLRLVATGLLPDNLVPSLLDRVHDAVGVLCAPTVLHALLREGNERSGSAGRHLALRRNAGRGRAPPAARGIATTRRRARTRRERQQRADCDHCHY